MRKNMIKWRPFYSIPGLNKIVKEIEDEYNKIPKPILSEDLIESINNTLIDAIENDLRVFVKYWKGGMLTYQIGKIKKVNTIEKYILVENTKIYFKNIINLKV